MDKLRLAVTALACAAANAAQPAPADEREPDEGRCVEYPIPWHPEPGAQRAAAAELARLSPAATMTWDDARGALSNVARFDVPLPGCVDGADVGQKVRSFLAAHPRLFQIDVREWPELPEFNCAFVPDSGLPADLTMGRTRLAGHLVQHDIFQVSVKKIGGVVTMTTVTGTYLPVARRGLGHELGACVDLGARQAAAIARATVLEAPVFQGEEICVPSGTVGYQPRANDDLALAPDAWTWGEDATRVSLSATRTLRVTVDPANYTPELLASAARCPVPDGPDDAFTIGWDITFDAHTGEILFVTPGLDCVVC